MDQFNRLPGLEGVFAVGDIALQTADPRWPGGLPQLAQVAIQQARRLADNLNRGRMATPFSYHDKGTMATVGRKRAIVRMGRLTVTGALAWWMWMVVHLLTLMGMRNRLVVFINWVWAYFSFSSSLRLLLRPSHHPLRFEEEDG